MDIKLAYDRDGLDIHLPLNGEYLEVVEPKYVDGLPDQAAALRDALQNPIAGPALRDAVGTDETVGIIFSDITRPCPNHLLLPAILQELEDVPNERIILFNALGTHRPNTPEELRGMLGNDPRGGGKIADAYRIVDNNSFDRETQTKVGTTSRNNDVWINSELVNCGFKLLTGFIEPHFFAGFSGGGKAVMPGMAGQDTILSNHGSENIDSLNSTFGVTSGNPIWEEVHEAAAMVDPSFILNVSLNAHKEITGVFAGTWMEAYLAGTEFVKERAMAPVDDAFDIVITSNSGYPLDLNLYQAVKGMEAAAKIIRPGGTILIAASCWDGIPDHGLFGKILRESESPAAALAQIRAPGFASMDQWNVHVQVLIQERADIHVYSDNLSDEQIKGCHLIPCRDIEATVTQLLSKYGADARICVLPEGPQTIPYIPE
jgi:nickel-dependent lactate racemase